MSRSSRQIAAQDVYDARVADALDIVVVGLAERALRPRHEIAHNGADDTMPDMWRVRELPGMKSKRSSSR